MSKVRDVLLTDTTRISISLATLIIVIVAVVGFAFTMGTWKAQMTANDERIETKVDTLSVVSEETDLLLEKRIDKHELVLAEVQSGTSDLKVSIARVEENILWLIEYVKSEGNK